jgi:CRISPR-associated endoribonuclease Cas6
MGVRLHLGLRVHDTRRLLAYDYNYFIAAFVYTTVGRASAALAKELHAREHSKNFTFSSLWYENYRAEKTGLRLGSDAAALTISFYEDRLAAAFLAGLYHERDMVLGSGDSRVHFEIVEIDFAEPPRFELRQRYMLLSPVVLTLPRPDGVTYLGPADSGYEQMFTDTLMRRALRSGSQSLEKPVMKVLGEPRSRLVTVAKRGAQTRVRGWQYAFELEATPRLHEFGYFAGFGSKCSIGFGCAEAVER